MIPCSWMNIALPPNFPRPKWEEEKEKPDVGKTVEKCCRGEPDARHSLTKHSLKNHKNESLAARPLPHWTRPCKDFVAFDIVEGLNCLNLCFVADLRRGGKDHSDGIHQFSKLQTFLRENRVSLYGVLRVTELKLTPLFLENTSSRGNKRESTIILISWSCEYCCL